jgi:hypothetical protein
MPDGAEPTDAELTPVVAAIERMQALVKACGHAAPPAARVADVSSDDDE